MSRHLRNVLLCILVSIGLISPFTELGAQQKATVADAQAQAASQKAIGELYGGRFRQAKSAAEKTALATEMIAAALGVKDGSVDQYVLLKIARDIAAGAGDAPTALRAVELTVERFDVSGAKLTGETLQVAARKASTSAQQKVVAEAVMSVVDAVAYEGEYELALSLCELARLPAQKTKQYTIAKELTAKIDELRKRQRSSREFQDAVALLEKNPTDPAANTVAGRHLCLVKGDWESGLPMLASGSDAELKAAATQDLNGANSAEAQVALGDAWWAAAEKKQGAERDTLRLRAGFWYRQAEPNLAGGLAGLKVKQRLGELERLGRDMPPPPRAAAPERVVTKAPRLAPGLVLRVFPKQRVQDGNKYEAQVMPADFGQPVGPPLLIATSEFKHDVTTNAIAFGYLRIDAAGDYIFETSTGYDRAALYLNSKVVNPFRDGETKESTVHLEPGMVPIAIVGWTIYEHVRTHWQPPGAMQATLIPPTSLFHDPNQPLPFVVENPDGKGHLPKGATTTPDKTLPELATRPAPKTVLEPATRPAPKMLLEPVPRLAPKTVPEPATRPLAKATPELATRPVPQGGTGARQPSDANPPARELAGLMGRARSSGNDIGVVLRYQPGRTLRQQTIEELLVKQGISSRDVQIEFGGALRIARATSVLIKHKGGSSNRGVVRLYLDDRELGVVGDDHTKSTTYQVELPVGIHVIRWTLKGGDLGRDNLIEFLDSQTNESLPVHVPSDTAAQIRSLGYKSEVDVSSD